jgi:uncharacterized membrane protein (TIGR02234 family)
MSSFRTHVALLLGGALLVLWGASLDWITWTVADSITITGISDHRTGADLRPLLRALGILCLAGVAGLLALRGRSRQVLGTVLGLGCGVVILFTALDAMAYRRRPRLFDLSDGLCPRGDLVQCVSDRHNPLLGPALVLVGAALLILAGIVAARRGGSWRGLGSSYETPGAAPEAPVTEKAVWDALDRGDDPTA